jgi:hypothetical protein
MIGYIQPDTALCFGVQIIKLLNDQIIRTELKELRLLYPTNSSFMDPKTSVSKLCYRRRNLLLRALRIEHRSGILDEREAEVLGPAVNEEDLARDPGGRVGQEEDGCAPAVLVRAHPAECDGRVHVVRLS